MVLVVVFLCRQVEETAERKSDRRNEDRKGVRLSVLRKRQGLGVGLLANKVWGQPVPLPVHTEKGMRGQRVRHKIVSRVGGPGGVGDIEGTSRIHVE